MVYFLESKFAVFLDDWLQNWSDTEAVFLSSFAVPQCVAESNRLRNVCDHHVSHILGYVCHNHRHRLCTLPPRRLPEAR